MSQENGKPDWWRENEQLREEMDLPPYQPPKFSDGEYLHEVINDLQEKYGIKILLIGKNTQYGEDWEITIDGSTIDYISRHRDSNANTIYDMDAEEFREVVSDGL